jgi:hypothetical protein
MAYLDTTGGNVRQAAAESAASEISDLALAIPTAAVADLGAVTVGSALGAFTDPPSAAEMGALRTFVNALKTDAAADRAKINDLLAKLRTAGLVTP